jgi:hypothetical protein
MKTAWRTTKTPLRDTCEATIRETLRTITISEAHHGLPDGSDA